MLLCHTQGAEGPVISTPSAVQSWMSLPLSTGLALPRISIPTPAPATWLPSTVTSESVSTMPAESGIAGSARMEKPSSRAPWTPSATTAGPALMPGARRMASSGTLARRVTPFFKRTCSRYSPPATSTVSPRRACARAAAMEPNGAPFPTASTRGWMIRGGGVHQARESHAAAAASSRP